MAESREYQRAREDALRILERRRRTRADLGKRLKEKGHEAAVVEAVCDRLEEVQLLDDREFARLYLKGRASRPRGARLAIQELRAKGVPAELAQAVFQERLLEEGEDGGEVARATGLARGSLKKVAGLPQREARGRLYQLLARRGFSSDVISEAVGQVMRLRDEEDQA